MTADLAAWLETQPTPPPMTTAQILVVAGLLAHQGGSNVIAA